MYRILLRVDYPPSSEHERRARVLITALTPPKRAASGFLIDPTSEDDAIAVLLGFFERTGGGDDAWERISQGAMERVEERYTWRSYAERLLDLSRIYGFWRHITSLEREETRRYLEMFYGLMYRPRAGTVRPAVTHADEACTEPVLGARPETP